MEKISAKQIIKHFLPSILKIIGDDKNFGWTKINSKFNEVLIDRLNAHAGNYIKEPTLFDVFLSVQYGNKESILQLNLLENLFSELGNLLDFNQKIILKAIVANLLKSSDYRYIDFVAELATLVNILKTSFYKLEAIEFKLPSSKSIDFKLKHINSEEISYVEVFSIHLNSDKVSSNPNEIEKFLTSRITKKIISKEFPQDFNYFIVPVLWGKHKELLIYSDFFQRTKFKINRVLEPLSFLTFIEMDGNIRHKCGRISELFNHQNYLSQSDINYLDGLS